MTLSKDSKTLVDFSPAAAIADQKDFITATATGSKSNETSGVALTFAHQLAQIELKAKNANEGYVFKGQGVRIGKPVAKGTFDFGTSAWTLGTDKTNCAVTYEGSEKTLTATAVSIMAKDGDNAMLLPQELTAWDSENDKTNDAEGAYLAVKVQSTTNDGYHVFPAEAAGEYDWVAVAIGTKWDAGKKYIYTLDFTNGAGKVDPEKPEPTDPTDPDNPGGDIFGGAIKFTVTVNDWIDAAEDIEM